MVEIGYQGADYGMPGLPDDGATIAVSFDNGTIQLDPGNFTDFFGVLGQRRQGYPPVVLSWFSTTTATFEGNINNLQAKVLVDAASTPLTGTISTSIALPFAVFVDLFDTGISAELPPGQTSAQFSLMPTSVAGNAGAQTTAAGSGLPDHVRHRPRPSGKGSSRTF